MAHLSHDSGHGSDNTLQAKDFGIGISGQQSALEDVVLHDVSNIGGEREGGEIAAVPNRDCFLVW